MNKLSKSDIKLNKKNIIKPKPCKVCKEIFNPRNSLQLVCGFDCSVKYALKQKERRELNEDKGRRKQRREALVKLKSRSTWLKEAQAAFNRYVRARDFGKPCISCGTPLVTPYKTGGSYDCGHWRSVGSAPHMRFNLFNVAGQCKKCNRYLSGAAVETEKGLIARLGAERVERIKYMQFDAKFTIDYLERLKKLFNKRAKFYENRI